MSSQTSTQLIPTSTGGQIEVETLWQNINPKDPDIQRVVVICHPNPLSEGNMHNKVVTTLFRFARDAGMHAVRFNFRGVGQSTGEYGNTIGEIDDTLTVLNWVKSQTNARELWLGGFSFGGYIAMRVAELVEAAQGELSAYQLTDLALIAPSIEKHETDDIKLPIAKSFCIFGDQDELVEPASLEAFVNKTGMRYKVVAEAGHFFHGKQGDLKLGLAAFTHPNKG